MATKTARKGGVKKQAAAKPIRQAPQEWCFWVHYGPVLGNLRELESALKTMSDEQYAYHVGKEKNDFANWVNDVLHERSLAQSIRRAKTRIAACKLVADHMKKN